MLSACSGGPYPLCDVKTLFPDPPRPLDATYQVDGRTLHYVEMPGSEQTRILFIHGSPGSWEAWAAYLRDPALQRMGTLIAPDRAGYGRSVGAADPNMAAQGRLLAPLLGKGEASTIVVGHSLGGPIAAQLALDYPGQVRAAVLIAPSMAPEYEHPRWYNLLGDTWIARWLAPDELLKSNAEMLPLREELQALMPRWSSLRVPTVVIQGEHDRLVDPRTADFAERVLPARWARIERLADAGHFVLWKQPQIVVDAIQAVNQRALLGTQHLP
ncbi:alpha/beta hydrolase [Sinimarinibacterium sp. CAU 1509]|uniref:alpha/beta fold hydrolase n=1 Tax=Sinimarinibacterium sp. CAU 1509 TaxID=2562283 RepID=UPI0010AC63BA|nr:alpha/beta hydrolase [Sinimarinibacterium sp. CAU 1509]TJY61032.1 alpha/beta hydrolase [Sinimarinibacterium sp. CAU 1509]